MAEANISVARDQFSCSICLDLFKDPVGLLCGHSFCMVCINYCWDQEDQQGVYSCPQCRQTFSPRPAVSKNTVLAEVVETLRKTRLQRTPPSDCSAGPEDVSCDSCTESKSKAIKSCLVCLASFCEPHLQPHYKSPAFKKHKLVEASRRLQEQICSQHDKLLEVYCRTDRRCICMLCTMNEHKGHDTVSAAAGRAREQTKLLKVQGKFQQKMQEKEQELQELLKAVESHKRSAQIAVQETDRIFNDLKKYIVKRHSEVTTRIREQEIAVVSRANEIIKQLEQEIAELKRRDAKMEELSLAEDPIHFLQSFQPLVTPAVSAALPAINVNPFYLSKDTIKYVPQHFEKISTEVKKILILPPQSREEFLQYSCQLTMDPNTAKANIKLSDLNRMATVRDPKKYCYKRDVSGTRLIYPKMFEHPERFDRYSQVLCSESICKPSYWEVEWSGNYEVYIVVSYQNISRKGIGDECAFGRNDKSWCLMCSSSGYSFLHNNQETNISMNPSSSKIGVFVDYKAGSLSFYRVSDTMTLLHRVQTTFTQPLYPGFGLNNHSTVKLCHLK